MINSYPDFSDLTLEHAKSVREFTRDFDPYSDFNFVSMYTWGDGSTRVSFLDDNLVLELPGYLDETVVHCLLGKNNIDKSVALLLNDYSKLELVPDCVVEKLKNVDNYMIHEDRDQHDYIYDVDSIAALSGSGLKKLRNKVNSFVTHHKNTNLQIEHSSQLTESQRKDIWHIDKLWAEKSGRTQSQLEFERKAILRILEQFNSMGLVATILTVDGEPIAYSINEVLGDDYALCHFEKALVDHHVNTGPFLINQVAIQLKLLGCKFLNWEQDLGIDGLRRSKMAYKPSKYLRKYTISRRS